MDTAKLAQASLKDLQRYINEKKIDIETIEEKLGLKKILKKFPDIIEDPRKGSENKFNGAVLLSDKIREFAFKYHLIFPFSEENLKGASYYLTVGNEYAIGNKIEYISSKDKKIRIPPFEVVIIKTREIINMPRFLVGRWNIRVHKAYEGLVWVGGPQVDPGWLGHLYCPVYNLSDKEVILELGEPLATIDFVLTTYFDEQKSPKTFKRTNTIRDIRYYTQTRLRSGLVRNVKDKLLEIERKTNRVESMIGVVFTVIAILFAALSIFVTSGQQVNVTSAQQAKGISPLWIYCSIGLSAVAVAFALFRPSNWVDILERSVKWLVILYVIVSSLAIVILCRKVLW